MFDSNQNGWQNNQKQQSLVKKRWSKSGSELVEIHLN